MEIGYYYFEKELCLAADCRLDSSLIKELFRGFCFQGANLTFLSGEFCQIRTVDAPDIRVADDEEYHISVSETGISLRGKDYSSTVRAFLVLLMRIELSDDGLGKYRIACCDLSGRYSIKERMIHFCVFPETSFAFIKKCIRLAGIMQYTHVVLEFWGMLKYECLKELAWPCAFDKLQADELVKEIECLGMKAIPMFNHLGHAAGCRVSGGKHVVLDQNPALAGLFSPDGWSWNVTGGSARSLLTSVRGELYELFPRSDCFHLGCDEVYSYESGEDKQRVMREYLHSLLESVHSEGRQPIIWGDMLLNREMLSLDSGYFCGCDSPDNALKMIASIPRYTIIADWHYDVFEAPLKSSVFLKEQGFEVLGVPWFKTENCKAHIDTITANGLKGIMVSTWHTLAEKMPHIVEDAIMLGAYHSPWSTEGTNTLHTETAALLRKLLYVNGNYSEAGWTDSQVFRQSRPMI